MKLHLIFFALVMVIGLLGRIIDGSRVLPPNAPFSSPFESHISAPAHQTLSALASPASHSNHESKAPRHTMHSGDRPWFGILETVFIDRSSSPATSIDPPLSEEPSSVALKSSTRPPSSLS